MAEHVELWGVDLNEIPVIGDAVSNEAFLRSAANGLAIGRALAGPAIAGYLATHSPEERTWAAGLTVAAIAASDRADGDIMRAYKGSLSAVELADYLEEGVDAAPGHIAKLLGLAGLKVPAGKAHFGAWIDQMSDKAFVYPSQVVLAARGEISPLHPALKFMRDRRVAEIKSTYGEITGSYPSASPLARWKTAVEMGGVAVAASPLSRKTGPDGATLTEYAFRAATALSEKTGHDYSAELINAITHTSIADIRALLYDGPN